MTTRTVNSQDELDSALADAEVSRVIIDSDSGVWLQVGGSAHVEARGSAHVVARGSAHVVAWGSAHVEAWDSAHVEAWGSAHVEAWGSAHVEARGSAHVEARGSAHVVARGSAHVVAWGSAHVEARDSAHVVAGAYTAVHLHSKQATVSGGVVIDMTAVDRDDPDTWIALNGLTPDSDGRLTVYKAVGDDWCTDRGPQWTYRPGTTVVAHDWQPTRECGRGLHFGVTPSHAHLYHRDATRYVECLIDAATIIPLGDKVKAPSCLVVREVGRTTRHGRDTC